MEDALKEQPSAQGEEKESENDAEAMAEETQHLLQAGPRSGNRCGALAFVAFAVVVIAALRFYLADSGSDAYINRLDTELLTHAEFSLAAMEDGSRMTVVPSWPLRLYDVLRRDVAVYAVLAAVAAYIWGLAARARGRRDAFLVHEKLTGELTELRARLDSLERRAPRRDAYSDTGSDNRKG